MNAPSLQFRFLLLPLALALVHPLAAATSGSTNRPASSSARSATTNSAPARVDYSTFRIVSERNIFNANRTARGVPAPPRETRRPVRVETVALVGTLEDERGPVAFFDGSSEEFRKAVKPSATLGGWKLASVTLRGVRLTDGTNQFDLKVGTSLRREDEGEWKLTSGTEVASASGGSSWSRDRGSSRAASASSPADSAPSGDAAEILRKMMERRAKEEQ